MTTGKTIALTRQTFIDKNTKRLKEVHIKADGEDFNWKVKKAKIMASSPITSWQIDGETMEIVTDFIFLNSKIMKLKDIYSLEEKLLPT